MGIWQTLFPDTEASIASGSFSERLAQYDVWKLPAVVAGRQLIADTVSGFPMTAENTAGVVLDPAPAICVRPDPSEPAGDTWEKLTNSLTRHGRAWVRVTALGNNGYPIAAEIVAKALPRPSLASRIAVQPARRSSKVSACPSPSDPGQTVPVGLPGADQPWVVRFALGDEPHRAVLAYRPM